MTYQSEWQLEQALINQLSTLEYDVVKIRNEQDMLSNLRKTLWFHNDGIVFSDTEFDQVLNWLNKGNVFERAKILRDRMPLTRDDGTKVYIRFLNTDKRCKNEYQVTHQINNEGSAKNRYDVTILVNGLPLVHIELKRRGLELKEAFKQIKRYRKQSFNSSYGLFNYVQLFVISNGVNTKYYANNKDHNFKQTFYRANEDNSKVTQLEQFAKEFLEPCHLSKMITKYIVLADVGKALMVLRPYQYYAVEKIIERVENSTKNWYIRHTTGSGKTLTSFKASQILRDHPDVHKVVFVVDRKDLDIHTIKEFNSFSKWSIDGTSNTSKLVKQFSDPDTKLIVTTIQKLNTAITKEKHQNVMEELKEKKVVFIFDECHRSQFWDTHRRIKDFFLNHQMFWFTGTPIFADNNNSGRTTKDLFDEALHKYVITDAIRDENVLRFSVDYMAVSSKEEEESNNKAILESPQRIESIAQKIIELHDRKTHSRDFTAILACSSVSASMIYYDTLKKLKKEWKHNLRIATIFSLQANEWAIDENGFIPDESEVVAEWDVDVTRRDKLNEYIWDYNEMFGSNFNANNQDLLYNYFKDIQLKVKDRSIDILIVVNMFLTGFDSKTLNTLYVDKNLKYHWLIQAYSRTNRILNELKSQGNIVCFRDLKANTDEAITLFSNKDAIEEVVIEPYETYVEQFNAAYLALQELTPTVDSVNELKDENDEAEFVKRFRELMRIRNVLWGFADYDTADFAISEQDYEDYKSKYLDIYDKVKGSTEKEEPTILDDLDFEVELLHRDEINVAYILALLSKIKDNMNTQQAQDEYKKVMDIVSWDSVLRKKKTMIEEFISFNMPRLKEWADIAKEFDIFQDQKKVKAFDVLCVEEKLESEWLKKILSEYTFTGKDPLREDIANILTEKYWLLERRKVVDRVYDKIMKFVDVYASTDL